MSELLLQTIVEKLEALEIALLRQDNSNEEKGAPGEITKWIQILQSEIKLIPFYFKLSNDKISELMKSINACNKRLEQPLQKNIEHKHHLHKGIFISIGLFVILIFL